MENPNVVELKTQTIEQDWEASRRNEVVSRLLANEDMQKIMDSFSGFKEAFLQGLDTLDCSDGRVLMGNKLGIAGSGLLLSDQELDALVERLKGKIKVVTTHDDCGAAAIKYSSLKPEEIPEGIKNSDEYGTMRGKQLAERLGAIHIYLNEEEMANEYHNEVAIVLDQTGKFNSTNLQSFPSHFVCSGAGVGLSESYMKTELETLTGIALGHHGYGDRFSSKNPFYILVAANNAAEQKFWEEAAKEVAAKFESKVSVKSFLSPEIENS